MLKKIFSITFVMVLMMGLSLVPAVVGADPGYDSSLTLENKNATWAIIDDPIQGTLEYDSSADLFWYNFSATGLTTSTNYSLIYYADQPDRFVDWGGSNPGALIATFMTDPSGNITPTAGSVDLNMDLPCSPDWNINPDPDYCDLHNGFDDYDHCSGAKIWLVPTSVLPNPYPDDGSWAFWDVSGILFETDLIWYDDTDDGDSTVALTAEVPDIVAISATPTSIDFGTVYPGDTAVGDNITLKNIGTKTVAVDATLDPMTGTVFNYLKLKGSYSPSYSGAWSPIISSLLPSANQTLTTALDVPSTYIPQGSEEATLIFEATAL